MTVSVKMWRLDRDEKELTEWPSAKEASGPKVRSCSHDASVASEIKS
jgi:hypothetical protein